MAMRGLSDMDMRGLYDMDRRDSVFYNDHNVGKKMWHFVFLGWSARLHCAGTSPGLVLLA